MKLRDSGMPDEDYWETLFDVPLILDALGIDSRLRDVAEFGCGFGTFSIPIAQRISGELIAFDIDPLHDRTDQRACDSGWSQERRDPGG
jgi:predicted RNA methylase